MTPAFQCKWLFSRIMSDLFWSHCLSLSGKKWTVFQSVPMSIVWGMFAFLGRDTSFSIVLWLFFPSLFSLFLCRLKMTWMVSLVVCVCHPFFSLTFWLIWYLKVLGNISASLINGVLWVTKILAAENSWVHRAERLFYLPVRFHLKTEVRCGPWLLFMEGIASWASIRNVLIWLCLSQRG